MIEGGTSLLDHLMPLVSSPWLYLVVFALVAIDGFFPATPSEAVVISLGALSATGEPNLVALAVAAVAGGMAGDRIAYGLGRRAGRWVRGRKLVKAKDKAERTLERYGGAAVLIARFLPYGRTASALTSGSISMPAARFRFFSAVASAAWAAYVIGLGRLGGAAFADSPLLGAVLGCVLGLSVGGVTALVGRKRAERRRAERPASRELVKAGGRRT
ncbi:VTT domain-containing protein [Actinoplanes sp. NPDC049596]|uniref:DedA family protein n=1 Tax=unclassified Actinoplanes TaxID=2626549 RepID=UPI003440962B